MLCGEVTKCDRGAEQGDPLGPVFCAVVIARLVEKCRVRLEQQGIVLADVWYMDDGQSFCDPNEVDAILKTLDEESWHVGMERGRGDRAKSVCRLVGSTSAKENVDASWYTEYIRNSCVPSPENDLEGHVLGINFDDANGTSKQFLEASKNAFAARGAVKCMNDVQSELAIMQACLSVCKVTHLLRAAGPSIDPNLYVNTTSN